MERRRLQIIYSGRVQGVGFRYAAKMTGRGFEVTGTVRNLRDDRVELIAEGERSELEAFAQAIRESGIGSLIKNEAVTWTAAQGGLRGFEIVAEI
jgi:acylphosphatase